MATIINAVDVVIKVDDVVVGCAQSAEFTMSREMDEASCAASGGWKQVSPGQKSWSASFAALYRSFTVAEDATQVSFDELFDKLDDGVAVTLEFGKVVTGGTRYSGEAYVSEIKYSQPDKGNVTWNANFTGNGEFVKITA
ncbi:phage tail tube protein [Hymenobacter sp. APR13]|uniref:phage tail tube protein n=1 Tax=Hymenobacter sp. APR13 TaxID=1356852 RepID=UPI000900516C|nr:phage tail tube protein [Hymenobacter sp. APR13]